MYLGCRDDDGDDVPYDVSYSATYTEKKYATKPYRARDLFVRMFMLTAVEQTKKCHSVSGARTLVRDDARPSQRTAHADRILRRHVVIRNVQRKIKLCAVRSKEHQPNNTRKHGEKKTYPGLKSFVCVCDKEPENKCI